MNKGWILVIVGAILEVGWVIGLKHADSMTTWGLTAIAIVLSFSFLIISTSKIPVGTAYAVFVGLGTTGTVLMEMLVFGYPIQMTKILLILVLLSGVIGLKLVTDTSSKEGARN